MYLLNSTLYIFGPCIGHRLDRNRVIPTDHYITDPNLFCLISIQFLHPFKSSVRSVFFTDKGLLASIFHLCQCQHLFIHTVFICAFHHICDISQILLCQIPIEPRYLREHRFDLFYLNSPQGAVGAALHEIIHFFYFYVWNGLFDDPPDACEAPALPWLLSEMVVEPIMRDERLRSINPYFERENGGCVYPYFYDMTLDGRPLLDTLYEMYRAQPIDAFMRESYAFLQAHEDAVRAHIRRAEQTAT